MWRNKTFIRVDFLPEGKPLITSNINKHTNTGLVSDFINHLLMRNYLDPVLESILKSSKKNAALETGEEIVENILSVQKDFEIRPAQRSRRNPIINPGEVMKNFLGDKE